MPSCSANWQVRNSTWKLASRRSTPSLTNVLLPTKTSRRTCRVKIIQSITTRSTTCSVHSCKKPGTHNAPDFDGDTADRGSVSDGEGGAVDGGADEGAESGFLLRALGEHRF